MMSTMSTVAAPVGDQAETQVPTAVPVAKVQGRFYRPELDMIRFGAFLGVFISHSIFNVFPLLSICGAFGLSLFFFLSSFLITELLQREKNKTGTIAMKSFYIRRGLRIWPLYLAFLVVTVVIGYFVPTQRGDFWYMMSMLFMVNNIYIGIFGLVNCAASFLWSISVEEQFYLLWPPLSRRCNPEQLKYIALCAFPIAGVVTVWLQAHHGDPLLSMWTNTLIQFQFFAFGALVSLGLAGRTPQLSALARVALAAATVVLWVMAAELTGMHDSGARELVTPLMGYYLVGVGCITLFLSVYGMPQEWVPAPLVYLGKISYGLYVFHRICLGAAEWLCNQFPATSYELHHGLFGVLHVGLGFGMTVVLGYLSYHYFETPFLKMKDRFAVIHSRTV